jgi:hypothetical protein
LSDFVTAALRELAEPSPRGERIKEVIERVARLCGLDYWRVYDMWYGRARRIEDHEYDAIADAVDAKRLKVVQNEYADLRARMARLEALMGRLGETDRRPRPDVVGAPLRRPGGTDRQAAGAGHRLQELMGGVGAPAWGRA